MTTSHVRHPLLHPWPFLRNCLQDMDTIDEPATAPLGSTGLWCSLEITCRESACADVSCMWACHVACLLLLVTMRACVPFSLSFEMLWFTRLSGVDGSAMAPPSSAAGGKGKKRARPADGQVKAEQVHHVVVSLRIGVSHAGYAECGRGRSETDFDSDCEDRWPEQAPQGSSDRGAREHRR